jgi:hypothetical protein
MYNGQKVLLNEIYVRMTDFGKLDIGLGYQKQVPYGVKYMGHFLGFPKYMEPEDLEDIEKYASEKLCEFFNLPTVDWDKIHEKCWEQRQRYIDKLPKK